MKNNFTSNYAKYLCGIITEEKFHKCLSKKLKIESEVTDQEPLPKKTIMNRNEAMIFILKRFHSMMAITVKPDFEKCLALAQEHNITVNDLLHKWRDLVL